MAKILTDEEFDLIRRTLELNCTETDEDALVLGIQLEHEAWTMIQEIEQPEVQLSRTASATSDSSARPS
jgi:hypothetical protein